MEQIVPETRETLESAGWQFTDKESIYAGCAAISKDKAGNYVWDLNAFFNALDGSSTISIPQTKGSYSRTEIIEKGLLTQEFLDNFDVAVSRLVLKADIIGTPNRIVGTGVVRMLQYSVGSPLWRYVCGTAETDINISIDYNHTAGLSVSTVRVYSYNPSDE